MKRSILPLTVAVVVGLSSFLATSSMDSAQATDTTQELENKQKEIQDKRSTIEDAMEEADQKIAELEAEQAKIQADMKRLDLAVAETNANIREKEAEIEATKKQIEQLKKEIEDVTKRIANRNDLLEERARSLQENGGVISYLDVLLGAQSFGDFLDRVSAVAKILNADKEILIAHQEDKQLKEQKEVEVTDYLVALEQKLADLEQMKNNLKSQIDEKNRLFKELEEKKGESLEEKYELEDEEEFLAAQEAAIKKEIERQKKLEEERKRSQAPPPVSDGSFTSPTTGTITSPFGPRWGTIHPGVDIANRAANVPIVAAASGTVFRSYYSSSYGNVIFITHNIDGQIYTTVYAHMESRSVNAGDTVNKGDMIGYMGNTGYSFGKHLHFEIHKGSWNYEKSNAVDPKNYINF